MLMEVLGAVVQCIELGRSETHSCPGGMFWLGNREQLGGSETIEDQLVLSVPKKDAIPLILHVHEDDFAMIQTGLKSLFETGGEDFKLISEYGNCVIKTDDLAEKFFWSF